jgi:hypothetical protein
MPVAKLIEKTHPEGAICLVKASRPQELVSAIDDNTLLA